MKTIRPFIHFVDNYLINPTNPVTVNVIGAGGTGSQVITALSRINQSLIQLRHPGLHVTVYDDDPVTSANLGRQLFVEAEIGLPKSVALINRVNRFFGTNWKAVTQKITEECVGNAKYIAHLTISCTDTIQSRFTIAKMLRAFRKNATGAVRPLYWIDFGNSRSTGQMLLSTVSAVPQPKSKKFSPVAMLPFITEEYPELLNNPQEDQLPSCSLADALLKQDLFINSALVNLGASLLWSMLREGTIAHRGFFLNLKTLQSQGIPIQ